MVAVETTASEAVREYASIAEVMQGRWERAEEWVAATPAPGICPRNPATCDGTVHVRLSDIGEEGDGLLPVDCPHDGTTRCPAAQERAARRLLELGFVRRVATPTWERVPADIRRVAKLYADTIATRVGRGQGLIIGGDTGAGKTATLALIASAALDARLEVVYLSAHRVFRYMDRAFENEDRLVEIAGCDLLLIDDLGTEVRSARAQSEFHDFMDARTGGRRSTCVTTNVLREELQGREDDPARAGRVDLRRVLDRLCELNPWLETMHQSQRQAADWQEWEADRS